jgi:NAD(P) transhydrogenase subunit alpha
MKVGVPRETAPGERRSGTRARFDEAPREAGVEVAVEAGAGARPASSIGLRGDRCADRGDALAGTDVVAKVQMPSDSEVARLGEGRC